MPWRIQTHPESRNRTPATFNAMRMADTIESRSDAQNELAEQDEESTVAIGEHGTLGRSDLGRRASSRDSVALSARRADHCSVGTHGLDDEGSPERRELLQRPRRAARPRLERAVHIG